ncbi:hypothetical protein BLOT_011164 [Blomia tropicalis]|nr:hypothetical protein BLOT_011164 [Blomia tropicalis]
MHSSCNPNLDFKSCNSSKPSNDIKRGILVWTNVVDFPIPGSSANIILTKLSSFFTNSTSSIIFGSLLDKKIWKIEIICDSTSKSFHVKPSSQYCYRLDSDCIRLLTIGCNFWLILQNSAFLYNDLFAKDFLNPKLYNVFLIQKVSPLMLDNNY